MFVVTTLVWRQCHARGYLSLRWLIELFTGVMFHLDLYRL